MGRLYKVKRVYFHCIAIRITSSNFLRKNKSRTKCSLSPHRTLNVDRHNAVMVFGITTHLRVASDFITHAQDERGKKTGGRKKQQHRHKHWWKKE